MSKLQEKPSALKREHPALKNEIYELFSKFVVHFLPSWIRIRIHGTHCIQIRNIASFVSHSTAIVCVCRAGCCSSQLC
jgi:hypothetical protein